MIYSNSKCPCGDQKDPGTMVCITCSAFMAHVLEHTAYRDSRLPIHARRAAAIRVLQISRRRKQLSADMDAILSP